MRAKDHPYYDEERRHLEETVRFAQEEVESWEAYDDVVLLKGAHNALAKSRIESIKRYKRVLEEPYFGRVDWRAAGSEGSETFYVGKTGMEQMGIYSWADNIAADLYQQGETDRENGKRVLKRACEIEDHEMLTITDEFVDE
ncbi:MAG: hypothetical protein ACOC6F_03320, partial [bacterium]